MPTYIYNPRRPRPQQLQEQWVIELGWPYASRVILRPGGELQLHSHHNPNTHWIMAGSITFSETISGVDSFEHATKHTVENGVPVEVRMNANVSYRARAGPEGCTFVEGHLVLSPTTAVRFAAPGRRTFLDITQTEVFELEVDQPAQQE